MVGVGGKHIIYNAMMATLNPNDEVIIPAPFWVSYPDIVMLAEGKPVIVKCDASQDFKITPEQLENNTKKINTTDAITSAAYTIAQNAGAKAIITFSVSGKTAFRMSKERAPVQIIGISPNIDTARKLQIVWGVNSCHTQDAKNTTEMARIACTIAKEKNIAKPGDSVVITAGVPFGNAGATNLLRIANIIADKNIN